MEIRDENRRKSTGRRFLDWVNGDEGFEDEENLDWDEGDEDDELEDYEIDQEENDEEKSEENKEEKKHTKDDLAFVDYEGDDEFDYPDEIIVMEEQGIEASDEVDYSDSIPIHQETVMLTEKQRRRMKRFRVFYLVLSAIVAINVIGVLLLTVNYLPPFGEPDNPAVNEVYTRYVEQGVEETGALNIVSAVLYAYRSFDTLGEALVLFTAAMGVIMLLRETVDKPEKPEKPEKLRKGDGIDGEKV